MATQPQFTAQPLIEVNQISVANPNIDGSGSVTPIAAVHTPPAGPGVGKRINRIFVKAITATTSGIIRFYISTDNNATRRLIGEMAIPAVTPSGVVPAFEAVYNGLNGLVLPGGGQTLLLASTQNANTFNITVESGAL